MDRDGEIFHQINNYARGEYFNTFDNHLTTCIFLEVRCEPSSQFIAQGRSKILQLITSDVKIISTKIYLVTQIKKQFFLLVNGNKQKKLIIILYLYNKKMLTFN